MANKTERIPLNKKQAWVDTFTYLCPYHDGGTGPGERCLAGGEPYTNCTGHGTFGAGGCSHVMEYFKTYAKFVKKELEF